MEEALYCLGLNMASTSGFWRISIECLHHPATRDKITMQPELHDNPELGLGYKYFYAIFTERVRNKAECDG